MSRTCRHISEAVHSKGSSVGPGSPDQSDAARTEGIAIRQPQSNRFTPGRSRAT